jgi:hypothetical protein
MRVLDNRTMKLSSITWLLLVLCYEASAQFVDDTLRYADRLWSMQKKAVILDAMAMTEAEKASFWPLYESYTEAIQHLELEYIRLQNLIEEANSDERKTAALTENMLTSELLLAKTRKYYYRRFRKALGATLASQFMQLDHDFRTMIRLQLQRSPSLMTSLNRTQLDN